MRAQEFQISKAKSEHAFSNIRMRAQEFHISKATSEHAFKSESKVDVFLIAGVVALKGCVSGDFLFTSQAFDECMFGFVHGLMARDIGVQRAGRYHRHPLRLSRGKIRPR